MIFPKWPIDLIAEQIINKFWRNPYIPEIMEDVDEVNS
jgi:hypothetical protein